MEAEIGVMRLQAEEPRGLLARSVEQTPLEPPEGTSPADTLISGV